APTVHAGEGAEDAAAPPDERHGEDARHAARAEAARHVAGSVGGDRAEYATPRAGRGRAPGEVLRDRRGDPRRLLDRRRQGGADQPVAVEQADADRFTLEQGARPL